MVRIGTLDNEMVYLSDKGYLETGNGKTLGKIPRTPKYCLTTEDSDGDPMLDFYLVPVLELARDEYGVELYPYWKEKGWI